MNCGSCPYTDGCCYTSLPPKVKCNITGEFHYYNDECNCEDIKANKAEELDMVRELLSQPSLSMTVNYGSDRVPAIDIAVGEAAVAYESLLNLPLYCEAEGRIIPHAVNIGEDIEAYKPMIDAPVEYGSMPCLICGEYIGINTVFGGSRKICKSCKKVIKFIKEKFKEELDNYEV